MRPRFSARQELIAIAAAPLGAAVLVCASVALGGWSNATALLSCALVLASGVFAVGVLRRALRRAARDEADVRELSSLREQQQHSSTVAPAAVVKRARGRRDAFNEILLGLEARAEEVQRDRDNLEQLVLKRTAELQKRNHAMRLVLDNVEEGLATIELDGKPSGERSRVFDQ